MCTKIKMSPVLKEANWLHSKLGSSVPYACIRKNPSAFLRCNFPKSRFVLELLYSSSFSHVHIQWYNSLQGERAMVIWEIWAEFWIEPIVGLNFGLDDPCTVCWVVMALQNLYANNISLHSWASGFSSAVNLQSNMSSTLSSLNSINYNVNPVERSDSPLKAIIAIDFGTDGCGAYANILYCIPNSALFFTSRHLYYRGYTRIVRHTYCSLEVWNFFDHSYCSLQVWKTPSKRSLRFFQKFASKYFFFTYCSANNTSAPPVL